MLPNVYIKSAVESKAQSSYKRMSMHRTRTQTESWAGKAVDLFRVQDVPGLD